MAYYGKSRKKDAETKWTFSASDGKGETKPEVIDVDDSGQLQMIINPDHTVSFQRPSTPQKTQESQKSPAAPQWHPRRRISREDNVRSTDLDDAEKQSKVREVKVTKVIRDDPKDTKAAREESVCVVRPTLNLQGKFSQENKGDGTKAVSKGGYTGRAQPTTSQDASSGQRPTTQPKKTEQRNMLPQQQRKEGDSIAWTRPTIDIKPNRQKVTQQQNMSPQQQRRKEADSIAWTRPTIDVNPSRQKITPHQHSAPQQHSVPQKHGVVPRHYGKQEDSIAQTQPNIDVNSSRQKMAPHQHNVPQQPDRKEHDSIAWTRPTIEVNPNHQKLAPQLKMLPQENRGESTNAASKSGYGSLLDRAQPAASQDPVSWQRPTAQNTEQGHVLPQQHGRKKDDSVAWTRPTIDINQLNQSHQKMAPQQNIVPQQHSRKEDDSIAWTRPAIDVNPNHQKLTPHQNILPQESKGGYGSLLDRAQPAAIQDPVSWQRPNTQPQSVEHGNVVPQQYGRKEDSIAWTYPTINVNASHQKMQPQQYDQGNDPMMWTGPVGDVNQSYPSGSPHQYANQDDSVTWTRPTIDINPNRQKPQPAPRQFKRQSGVNPAQEKMSPHQYGGHSEDSVAWTRPTIDLRSNPHSNNDPAMDMRDSHNTNPTDYPDGAYGYRNNQNSDEMVWNRPTIDLDVATLGEHQQTDVHSPLMSAMVKTPLQRQDSVTEIVAADLVRLQAMAFFNRKGVVVREVDEGQPCLKCAENCPGFISHQWRNICMNCKCARDVHDVYHDGFVNIWDRLGWEVPSEFQPYSDEVAHSFGFSWIPPGISMDKVEEYMEQLDNHKIPKLDTDGERYREIQLIHQLPKQDLSEEFCKHLKTSKHRKAFQEYCNARDTEAMGIGRIKEYVKEECKCARSNCGSLIEPGDMAVIATKLSEDLGWHPACFVCGACEELLVDLHYCHKDGQIFCERHYAELERPRCSACDELIFSGEYTKAMDQDWHSGHFCCWNCDLALTGHRYILRDEHPFCIKCYESLFANPCEECKTPIGTDSKDLSYKDKHWHEKCFKCKDCQKSLVDQPFASKDEKLYCADCHDNNFAPRCDGCGNVFKAGMKKFEFRGKQWHEDCFICFACRQPIGNKRFIPRDHEFVCVPCYEEQFAQRCAKCNGVINKGGITYKGTPFHRDCFTCSNCSRVLAGEKFTSRDERPYCADCFGELFAKKCCRCTRPITGLGGTKFISFDERHWHSDCFGCYKCGVSLVGRGFLTCGEDVVCPECGKTM